MAKSGFPKTINVAVLKINSGLETPVPAVLETKSGTNILIHANVLKIPTGLKINVLHVLQEKCTTL